MTTEQNLVTAVGEAVDDVVGTAETIHRKIAEIPIEVLEALLQIEKPLKEVRRIQSQTIGAIYDLVRVINKEITQAAGAVLDEVGEFRASVIEEGPRATH